MLKITFLLILFVVLFMLSALFSASETALVSLSHYRLKKLILKKQALSHMFRSWLSFPHHILTAILIGNNVVNIALTTLTTVLALSVFYFIDPKIVAGGVWLILMTIILVFCEITPKIFGRRYPEAISIMVIRPLYLIASVLKPLINLNILLVKPLAFGSFISPVKNATELSLDEVKRLIKESGEGGGLGKYSTDMMQKVLSLNDITVEEIMTKFKDVESIDIERLSQKKLDIIDEVNEIGHTRIPVVKGEKTYIIGYINVKDIFMPMEKGQEMDLYSLIRVPLYVHRSVKISDVLKEFKSSGVLIAVVRNDHSHACGIVTIEDVLEEIVGEILDEYDIELKGRK